MAHSAKISKNQPKYLEISCSISGVQLRSWAFWWRFSESARRDGHNGGVESLWRCDLTPVMSKKGFAEKAKRDTKKHKILLKTPNIHKMRPKSAQISPNRPKSAQFGQNRPKSAEIGQNRPKGKTWCRTIGDLAYVTCGAQSVLVFAGNGHIN